MDSKHFKTDKKQRIEKLKKYHQIGLSAFALFSLCTLPISASFCYRAFNKILTGVYVRTWGIDERKDEETFIIFLFFLFCKIKTNFRAC